MNQSRKKMVGVSRYAGLALPAQSLHKMVGVPGLEPGTSSLSGTRSNQLSYTPGQGLKSES